MNFNHDWILKVFDSSATKHADELAQRLQSHSVSASSLRNIFNEMKQIQSLGAKHASWETRIAMLRPRIAYVVGRNTGESRKGLMEFQSVLNEALTAFEKSKETVAFNNVIVYFEALLAYKTYHENLKKP